MKKILMVSAVLGVSLIGWLQSANAALVLQYDTWPTTGSSVINTGTTGTSGTLVTPGDATTVAGPPAEGPYSNFALHMSTASSPSDYISANQTPSDVGMLGSFTAGSWVKLDSTAGDHFVFGTDYGGGGASDGLHLGFRGNTALFGFFANDTQTGGGAVSAGSWNYWVWRYDSGAGTQTIFKDGVELLSAGGHGALTRNSTLQIGRGIGGGNIGGSLDDVRIYNTALSNAGIASLFAEVSQSDSLPEPSSFMLMSLGLVGLYAGFKRTKK